MTEKKSAWDRASESRFGRAIGSVRDVLADELESFTGPKPGADNDAWMKRRRHGGVIPTAIAEGLADAIDYPRALLSEEKQIRNPDGSVKDEAVGWGLETGTGMGLTAKAITKANPALGPGDNSLGVFIGEKGGKRIGKDGELDIAKKLYDEGFPIEDIRKETNWSFGPRGEGDWQFEISDHKSGFKPDALVDDAHGYKGTRYGTIGENYDHPELFQAYPDLANVRLYGGTGPRSRGLFDSENASIDVIGENEHDLRRILGHELQHGVDALEKKAGGSSPAFTYAQMEMNKHELPEAARKAWDKLPHQQKMSMAFRRYRHDAGEVNAETTAQSMDLNEVHRREIPPEMRYPSDVDPNQITVGRASAKYEPAESAGPRVVPESAKPPGKRTQADLPDLRSMELEKAYKHANKTFADYLDKHTAYATHEALPGSYTGHMPKLQAADEATKDAYAMDPRSTWATAPGGRDAIYSGYGLPETGMGVSMRVRPTTEMTGVYKPENGPMEHNRGEVARPLVAFDATKTGHEIAPADKQLLDSAESVRGYIDAQNGGAWHKPQIAVQPGVAGSLRVPLARALERSEAGALSDVAKKHGYPDISDTGRGVTLTDFMDAPGGDRAKAAIKGGMLEDVRKILPDAGEPQRARIDGNYLGFEDWDNGGTSRWSMGEGKGKVTAELLERLDATTPEIRGALDRNPLIPEAAEARRGRDSEWAERTGDVTRADIQNARRIIGEGPGWQQRLKDALSRGEVLPAVAATLLGAQALPRESEQ